MQAPSNLTIAELKESYVKLTWKLNSTNQVGVRIWRTEDSTWKIFNQIHWSSNPTLSSFVDTTVLNAKNYYYKVSVWDFNSQSAFSNGVWVFTPGKAIPNAPSDLLATPLSSTEVRLTWKDNSNNEDGFRVERLVNNIWTTINTLQANSNTYLDTGLNPSTVYWYRVAAFNSAGTSISGTSGVGV